MKTLNLARQPFRNERLPTLALGLCLVALVALSVRHGLVAFELRPGGARDSQRALEAAEKEVAALRAESRQLQEITASKEAIEEWGAIKDLVDRRVFSWTGLFAALESALPAGARLESVSPTSTDGPILIKLEAVGRSIEDALALPKALQAQGEFEEAFLESYAESEHGVKIRCTVRYVGAGRNRATGESKR